MDKIDLKILRAIDTVSPKSFVSPVKVNEILKLDEAELEAHLKLLKKSGHLDIMTAEYPSSLTIRSISRVFITEMGRQSLKKKR